MPKAVLTTTTAAAAPAPAVTSAPGLTAEQTKMATNLRNMGLEIAAIAKAIDVSIEALAFLNPAAAATPAPASAPVAAAKTVTPTAPPVTKPVAVPQATQNVVKSASVTAPAPAPAPAAKPISDEEYAAQMAAEQHSDLQQGVEPDEVAAPAAAPSTALAAPAPASAEAVDDEDDHAPAGPATAAVALQNQWSRQSGGAMVGAFDRSDFRTPQLKIIQGSGENSRKFNQGTLVFTEIPVFQPPLPDQPTPAFNFIPVAVQKYFRENLPEGSKVMPRNANTPEEVTRLGGTLEFTIDGSGKKIKPNWSPAARWTLIIEKPEGVDHPAYTIAIDVNGKTRYFAACVFYVNSGAYREFSKPIIDATNFILRNGDTIVLHKRVWKFQVAKVKSGDFMVFSPKISLVNEITPPDLVALAESLTRSST